MGATSARGWLVPADIDFGRLVVRVRFAGLLDQIARGLCIFLADQNHHPAQAGKRLLHHIDRGHEFDAVSAWSNQLVEAKKRMDVGKYATSPGALREDPASQKIIGCGRFLATMIASSEYRDDPSCH